MVGMATGLAEAGFIPYCYSIATFASLRPYEMIRNGPLAHGLPVRLVGVGVGFEYGQNGVSHYSLEDAGVMRMQPGMTVVTPADHLQARTAVLKTVGVPGPVYYRLGKDDVTLVDGLRVASDLSARKCCDAVGHPLPRARPRDAGGRGGSRHTRARRYIGNGRRRERVEPAASRRSRRSPVAASTRGDRRGALRERCAGLAHGRDDR